MQADQLFQAGRLEEAVRALGSELRDNPADTRRRTFLFELLCFAGQYDRAAKQLDVLAQAGPEAELGTLIYRSALHAEQLRNKLFESNDYPAAADLPAFSGTLNGQRFEALSDGDPRIGARLEVFAGGDYLWIPFAQIASIEIEKPRRLRDLLWAPAKLLTGPGFESRNLGEVLLPVLTPFSWRSEDDAVRLGRATVWEERGADVVPVGQKLFLVDGEELPFLELRQLKIEAGGQSDAAE